MSEADTPIPSNVVAVYTDQAAAESAVQYLHEAGFPLDELSIVGRNVQEIEEPVGPVTRRELSTAGAETGAVFGGLLGVYIGAGFLALPGIGLVVVGGPIAAAILAAIEGGVAGAALGALAGALVGWKVPKHRALQYETHVKEGKFLVVVRSTPPLVARARGLLAAKDPENIEAFDGPHEDKP